MPIIHDIQSGLADGLGMIHSGLLKRLMVFAERTILNRTSTIAVLTDAMRRTLRRQGVRRPIEVVPIWVNTEAIHPLPRRPGTGPVVLYAGNLGRKQGLDQVIGAASVLADEAPEIRVVIRGRGARRGALEARAAELGLSNVEFLDLVPTEELNECLGAADVHLVPQAPDGAEFAVPSKAFGIMAAGRPFVATAAPGTSLARLGEETGAFHCVPPNDERQLARAIIRLARTPEECERLGQRGRRYVVDHLSRDAVLTRFAELLDFRPVAAGPSSRGGGG